MQVSLAPIVMVQKGGVDVLTAITRLLIRIIVGQRNLLLFNWKKVNAFAHKYPEMKYLAYFQAYTNTYAELEGLKRKYEKHWRWMG